MLRIARIIAGIIVVGLVLHAADLATRDCRLGPYVYDDCMWLWVRHHFGLPESRLLRMATLEIVGIALAIVLYFTFKYIFPFRTVPTASQGSPQSHPQKPSMD